MAEDLATLVARNLAMAKIRAEGELAEAAQMPDGSAQQQTALARGSLHEQQAARLERLRAHLKPTAVSSPSSKPETPTA